jgi:hypothetical protein
VVAKRNIGNLVEQASSDIQGTGDAPVRRGRGVAGMFGDGDEQASTQAVIPTSPQVDLYTSEQVEQPRTLNRISRSYRVDEEIAHAFDVLAVQQRRKLYEALEEAMLDYLTKYGE